ncbi:MAG: hypothetical protein SFT90_03330 [Rickettsiales bacterium]|nr:hypothetical protein [Rickettsiales bacterium]
MPENKNAGIEISDVVRQLFQQGLSMDEILKAVSLLKEQPNTESEKPLLNITVAEFSRLSPEEQEKLLQGK